MPDIIAATLRQVTTLVNEDRRHGKPLGTDGFYARVQNLVIAAFDTADVTYPTVTRAGAGLSFEWRDGRRSITVKLEGLDRYTVTETSSAGDTVSVAEGTGRPSPDGLRARVEAFTAEIRAADSARATIAAEQFNRDAIIRALDEALWDRGNNVRTWPADEAEAYREKLFEAGREAARAIVIGKAADAVLAVLSRPSNHSVAKSERLCYAAWIEPHPEDEEDDSCH